MMRPGLLCGDNTDGAGLLRDLTHNIGFNIQHKQILLLGAGGACTWRHWPAS